MNSTVSKNTSWENCKHADYIISGISVCTLHQRPCMMSKCPEHGNKSEDVTTEKIVKSVTITIKLTEEHTTDKDMRCMLKTIRKMITRQTGEYPVITMELAP